MIHQAELVVGIGFPGPVDLDRAGGLATGGVAQVRRDAAVVLLELLDRIKGGRKRSYRRVQSPAREQQQREARTGLLIVDANWASFIKLARSRFVRLLSKYARRGGPCRCHGARCEYSASGQAHDRRPPLKRTNHSTSLAPSRWTSSSTAKGLHMIPARA